MSDINSSLEEGMDLLKDAPRSSSSNIASDRSEGTMHQSLKHSAIASVFVLIAWYYPRHLIHIETHIGSKTPPYQQTQGGDVILDFNLLNPVADPPTIPSRLLMWTSVWFPLLGLLTHAYIQNKGPQRLIHMTTALGGFATAIGISESATVLLKLWIQRPRPNYYSLCGFDKTLLKCTANLEHIREANFSFPSGHSSLTNCGMTFLVLYSVGQQLCKGNFSLSIPFNIILPWGWAIFVAASRLVDKWHHPSDVVAGLALGFVASAIAYHIWYPPLWSKMAGMPRSLCMANVDGLGGMNKLVSFTE
ncbi:unnamed protein product [Cylindrotheca closterium]|uniref:Phosphatidic acid phosphatase type 2/haloperoxidase domain-containing protein n=1 Tax=Cylindrotheca closterium TaxID=2856 RepID=A0AAD2CRF3_9STRA|nr:unnamed protein product [Cylindrotheca closterium]